MPELPEVETIVNGLSSRLLGQVIESVKVLRPSIIREDASKFPTDLSGKMVKYIHRHGKFIFISVQDSQSTEFRKQLLKIHLGMTGQLLIQKLSDPILKHTHVIFRFENLGQELRYRDQRRFGFLELIKENQMPPLGPDAWSSSMDELIHALLGKRGALKHALLNQGVIAGMGNIYVDEALHRTKLHPQKTLQSLSKDKVKELCTSIKSVLKESIDLGGTSFRNYVDTQGGRGGFKGRLSVYGKMGQPCGRCHSKIQRLVVAGRGTHICPRCQRLR